MSAFKLINNIICKLLNVDTSIFYFLRPIIPRGFQLYFRRKLFNYKLEQFAEVWPIDETAGRPKEPFRGWPENKQFSVILTHDVETEKGNSNCLELADLEKRLGFRSSFNFVPERYEVSSELRKQLVDNGFEVGVHGLNHDGKLYKNRNIFKERVVKINAYVKEWGSVGFRSPSMHHNLEWIHDLDIEYDSSTFDTDPFEPQPDGMGTIFPFCIHKKNRKNVYVELPYTLPQDFTLFILKKEKNIDVWLKKLDWIAKNGGMALVICHPDYMQFSGKHCEAEEYPAAFYEEFLQYIKDKYEGKYWHVLPKELARFWRDGTCNRVSD